MSGKVTILEWTTKNPLQQIGYNAGVCWGANVDDKEKNIKRAKECIKSGHGRVMEFPDVYVVIDDYSAKCIRELFTHIGGSPTRLQASTRYIDYSKGFKTIVPPSVKNNEKAIEVWEKAIDTISKSMISLKELGIPNEDLTNLLPLAYSTKMVWKVNLRTLINFFGQRKCYRAYLEIRKLCDELIKVLSNYSDEWSFICKELFVPKCEQYKFINKNFCFCTEEKGCGRYPNIKDLKIIKNN